MQFRISAPAGRHLVLSTLSVCGLLGMLMGGCAPAVDVGGPGATAISPEVVRSIVTAPEVLDFSTSLTEMSLVVGHYGYASFSYSVASSADWVSVDRAAGTASGSWVPLKVRVNRGGLSTGQHRATLSIEVNGQATKAVEVVALALGTVNSGNLYLSTEQLDFGYATEGLGFLLRPNEGTGGCTLRCDADWALVSPAVVDGQSDYADVAVTVSRAGLGAGTHTGLVHIETSSGERYQVSLVVSVDGDGGPLRPTLEVDSNLLDLGDDGVSTAFSLSHSGAGRVSYTIMADEGWVAFSPSAGDIAEETDEISVAVNREQLTPGAYVCRAEIRGNDGTEREIWVTLQVLEPGEPSAAQILAWLQELEPLPKVHYCWSLREEDYKYELDPLIPEYIRLCHAASLCLECVRPQDVAGMVELCDQINRGGAEIPARLAFVYSPYHGILPEDVPPTYAGPEVEAATSEFRTLLEGARDALDSANVAQGADVFVGAIIVDTELWYAADEDQPDREEWNAALDAKYDAIYDIAKDVFPEAVVEWYARGQITRGDATSGYYASDRFTLNEQGDTFAVSLYRVPEPEEMRTCFSLTLESAQLHGVDNVTAWVALAAGYRRQTDYVDHNYWYLDWDYEVYYSWQMGAELNDPYFAARPERFAAWDHADVVVFYPEAFGRTPHWAKHFVAYVRGAQGIGELP